MIWVESLALPSINHVTSDKTVTSPSSVATHREESQCPNSGQNGDRLQRSPGRGCSEVKALAVQVRRPQFGSSTHITLGLAWQPAVIPARRRQRWKLGASRADWLSSLALGSASIWNSVVNERGNLTHAHMCKKHGCTHTNTPQI